MHHHVGPIHRRSSPSAVRAKQAGAALRPFIGEMHTWNAKAAHLRARAASIYSSAEERSLARLESNALLAEVRRRHVEFQAAVKGEAPHGRLDDVDAAFCRIADQLEDIAKS